MKDKTTISFVVRCVFTVLVSLAGAIANAQDVPNVAESKVNTSPPANWVKPLMFQRMSKVVDRVPGEEQRWLLVERQINAAENATFSHAARQILSIAGAQANSTLSINFDPSYQTLAFHWIRIWRGTNFVDQLDRGKIKLIQQEKDLSRYIFNGQQTAVLVLEDVRAGDVLDYAYTVQGANPVLGGKFADSFTTQTGQSLERLVTRVLWPSKRKLYTKNHGVALSPTAIPGKELTEYKWDFRDVPGLKAEDSLPGWYEAEPWVQLSEFQTWGQVNQWAVGLFQDNAGLSPALKEKVEEWRKGRGQEEQVMAVLRFMQDEVRYFGVEMGASSHQPSGASIVFERRYGDCKDKVQLFVTALRALGIEAYPVLVSANLRQTVEGWQPSPYAFDHVIAQVRIGAQTYWLDPTMGYQRGPLTALYRPEYGRGLVVTQKTTALTSIPRSGGQPETTIKEYFVVKGKDEPADYKVVTVVKGLAADILREDIAATPRDKLEEAYVKFYSQTYPGIRQTSSTLINDNEQSNQIETTEIYSIDRFWMKSQQDGSYRCNFFPLTVASVLKSPNYTRRTMPLAVPYPNHIRMRTEVIFPVGWQSDYRKTAITDPAFTYRMEMRTWGTTTFFMDYEYDALADSVAAGRVGAYLRNMEDAKMSLGYSWSTY